jgi:selenocysteine lyase/cysteine desulfurase
VVDAMNFLDYNFTLLPTAERFSLGSSNIIGAYGLHASVALIQEIGVDQVAERVLALASTALGDLQERGYRISGSTAQEHRSGIVIVEVDDPAAANARLQQDGIITMPRGKVIRLGAHFYNTDEEILRVGATLSSL